MDETAILIIQEYMDKDLFEPCITWPKPIFQERCYARWTAFEIQNAVLYSLFLPPEYELLDPVDIIIKFISEVSKCLHIAKNTPNEQLFTVAKNTAIEILNLFL